MGITLCGTSEISASGPPGPNGQRQIGPVEAMKGLDANIPRNLSLRNAVRMWNLDPDRRQGTGNVGSNNGFGGQEMQLTRSELLMIAQGYFSEAEECVIDAEIDRMRYFDEHRWSEALQPVWIIRDQVGKEVLDGALSAAGEHYRRRSQEAAALLRGIWLGAAGGGGSRGCERAEEEVDTRHAAPRQPGANLDPPARYPLCLFRPNEARALQHLAGAYARQLAAKLPDPLFDYEAERERVEAEKARLIEICEHLGAERVADYLLEFAPLHRTCLMEKARDYTAVDLADCLIMNMWRYGLCSAYRHPFRAR